MIDTSGMSPRCAQEAVCVTEMAQELRKKLFEDVESHIIAVRQGETITNSPLQQLKMKCMARLGVLAEFHEISMESMLEVNARCAMAWAVDHATVMRVAKELAAIDCSLLRNDNQEEA